MIKDMLQRLAMLAILALSLLTITTITDNNDRLAFACSCGEEIPPLEALEESDAVFAGKVLETRLVDYGRETDFYVNEAWKGVSDNMVTITTPGSDCSYGFQKNNEYLVYAYEVNDRLGANICSRTSLISNAEADLIALGEGDSTLAADSVEMSIPVPYLIGIGAAIAGVIAFLTLRKRK